MRESVFKFRKVLLFYLILALRVSCVGLAQENQEVGGIWKGTLKLDIVFKINQASDGSLIASFNTLLQEVFNVPVKHVSFTNDSLYLGIELSDVNKSHFRGVFNRRKNVIEGFFNDGIYDYPMTLEKAPLVLAQMVPRVDARGNISFFFNRVGLFSR